MKKTRVGAANQKGFTLLELAVALAGLMIVTTSAIPYFIRQAETVAAQRTAKEVSVIQEAAKWYRVQNSAWPASVATLQAAGFLNPSWAAQNPWGSAYAISSGPSSLTVTTTLPDSMGGVLTRALPGVSTTVVGTDRIASSTIPVPGQEASILGVTNLANNALSTANNAQSTANSAQSTANSAYNNANTAISTANSAVTTANSASSTAGSALSTANSATTTANSALANSNSAISTANSAVTSANSAISTANSAYNNANTAIGTANSANTTASSALTNANSAISTANSALTNSNSAISTANSAVTSANSAISTANSAYNNANTAISTANSASSTASTALSTAQQSALPPYGVLSLAGPNTGVSEIFDCPAGYAVVGIGTDGAETVRSVRCQKVAR